MPVTNNVDVKQFTDVYLQNKDDVSRTITPKKQGSPPMDRLHRSNYNSVRICLALALFNIHKC